MSNNRNAKLSQQLAADLDAAERVWLATDTRPDDFDYEDDNGHLHHRADECPLCILANARDKYFSLMRVPADELRDNPPTDLDKIPDLTPIIHRLFQKWLAAQARLAEIESASDETYSARTHIDAQAIVEFAEIEYRIYERPWLKRMEAQAAERRAKRSGHVTRSAVTNGYVKTGKTVLLDGERVPVVERVKG